MKIVSFNSDSSNEFNSGNFRGVIPCRAINKLSGHSYTLLSVRNWLDGRPEAVRACNLADTIIVQRVAVVETLSYIGKWRKQGKTVVFDQDDQYEMLENDNQAYKFWKQGLVEVQLAENIKYEKRLDRHPIETLKECLKVCSAGTAPGKELVEYWKTYGNMRFLPNYVDSERYLSVPPFQRKDDKIVVGYGGSMSHVPSFMESGVNEALSRVVQKRKNVMVLVCGDKRVHDNLPVPDYRKAHQQYIRAVHWPKIARQFDLTIAPLARKYDHFRSDIKCMEACLLSIPFVATRSRVYEDYEQAGIGLYVPNGDYDKISFEERIEAWESSLLEIIDHLDEWKEKASHWVDWIIPFRDITVNARNVIGLYEAIATL